MDDVADKQVTDDKQTKGQEKEGTESTFDFDAWLQEQSEEVRAALQAKFDKDTRALQSALRNEREARKTLEREKQQSAAEREAEEQRRLEENNEFKQLAELRAQKVKDLEEQVGKLTPLQERVKELDSIVSAHVEALSKDLPAYVKPLLETLPPEKRLEWLNENAEALSKKKQGARIEPTPEDKNQERELTEEQERKARASSLSFYRNIF